MGGSSSNIRLSVYPVFPTQKVRRFTRDMSSPSSIEITSCALGGHLLGRGTAVQKAVQKQFPNAEVKNSYGCPLQFSITSDGQQILGGLAGTCKILQLLTCCTSPEAVAEMVPNTKETDDKV